MKSYGTFFFDLDGTIIDSSVGITNSVMYALKRFGIEETDRTSLYKFIGPPLTESFERFYGFDKEKAKKAVEVYREYYADKGIFEIEVYDGIAETVKALKKAGKKVVVATSKPEIFARRIMEYIGLSEYFDYIAGMGMDGARNTKAEVIDYAIEACQLTEKEKILMIGDREHDVLGAKRIGIDCVGVLYGFGSKEEFEEAGATYIVEKATDVLTFV